MDTAPSPRRGDALVGGGGRPGGVGVGGTLGAGVSVDAHGDQGEACEGMENGWGAVSEGRVVGGSNPGGGGYFLGIVRFSRDSCDVGAGLMDWCAVSRTLDASDADGVANAPSTVATSETAQDTRLVSTTRAHTSSPARGIGRGRQRRGGGGGKSRIFLETRVWAKGRRRSRKLCVGVHPRTSPGGAIGSAEAALAKALVPLDVHLIAVEVRQVRAQLGDLRHALLELGGVCGWVGNHDGGELRERDLRG